MTKKSQKMDLQMEEWKNREMNARTHHEWVDRKYPKPQPPQIVGVVDQFEFGALWKKNERFFGEMGEMTDLPSLISG
jgi:hypothetical protein